MALKQASTPTWQAYAKQVVSNAKTLASELVNYGYRLQTDGTDNHLILWDLRPSGVCVPGHLRGADVRLARRGRLVSLTLRVALR